MFNKKHKHKWVSEVGQEWTASGAEVGYMLSQVRETIWSCKKKDCDAKMKETKYRPLFTDQWKRL